LDSIIKKNIQKSIDLGKLKRKLLNINTDIDKKLKTEEKIPYYQTASIIRLAILEGAAFLILFLKPDFLLFGILIILYIIFLRPTEQQFRRDFENTRL
jgi:hypothetical protein